MLLLVLLGAMLPAAAHAHGADAESGEMYVYIEGFPGTTDSSQARGAIPLTGFSSAMQQDPAGSLSGGELTGSLSFDKASDTSTPFFYEALASGAPLYVEFWFYRTTSKGSPERFFTIAAKQARIVSVQSVGGAPLHENIAITFDRIDFRDELSGAPQF
jgi:type VI secretion system Hcp family effector